MWQVSGLPCQHAAATILILRRKVEIYVDEYFSSEWYRQAYSQSIAPMADKNQWEMVDVQVGLPHIHHPRGRPKKKRIRYPDEGKQNQEAAS